MKPNLRQDMIIGSGLIARAFMRGGAQRLDDTCFYAAGVSNSGCCDEREFLRERARLAAVIAGCSADTRLVYFSTCSIADSSLQDSGYVKHKRHMEERVRERANHLILRLPQVAGATPNPHTLLNYLHERIARSERFQVWSGATRNIIDVEDIVRITLDLIVTEGANAETINIASPHSTRMPDIVHAMECAMDTRAVFDIVDRGSRVLIDTGRITAAIRRCAPAFGDNYLGAVIGKYYGVHDQAVDALPVFRPDRTDMFHRPGWQF